MKLVYNVYIMLARLEENLTLWVLTAILAAISGVR